MKSFFYMVLLACLLCPLPAVVPRTGRIHAAGTGAAALSPYMERTSNAADDYADYSLSRFPDVLDKNRFNPKRFAHIRAVMRAFHLFRTRDFSALYDMLPAGQDKTEYLRTLESLHSLYAMLDEREREDLETAVILHDIGYPGGRRSEHPKRGGILARQILPPEKQRNIPLLIAGHSVLSDIGTYWLMKDLQVFEGRRLTDTDRIQLLLLSIFDDMGKVKPTDGSRFKNHNAMTWEAILILAEIMAQSSKTPEIAQWFESLAARPLRQNSYSDGFWLYRMKYSIVSPSFVQPRSDKEILDAVGSAVGHAGRRRKIFEEYWSNRIRVHVFTLFLNLSREDDFDGIVKLAAAIADFADRSVPEDYKGGIIFNSDIDYMSSAVQPAYSEHFKLLISMLAAPDWKDRVQSLFRYRADTHSVIFSFHSMDAAAEAGTTSMLGRAA